MFGFNFPCFAVTSRILLCVFNSYSIFMFSKRRTFLIWFWEHFWSDLEAFSEVCQFLSCIWALSGYEHCTVQYLVAHRWIWNYLIDTEIQKSITEIILCTKHTAMPTSCIHKVSQRIDFHLICSDSLSGNQLPSYHRLTFSNVLARSNCEHKSLSYIKIFGTFAGKGSQQATTWLFFVLFL